MLIDKSYHPSTITMLNLDTVFNPQVMMFETNGFDTDGTEVELTKNRRSFGCLGENPATSLQCGQVRLCLRVGACMEAYVRDKCHLIAYFSQPCNYLTSFVAEKLIYGR